MKHLFLCVPDHSGSNYLRRQMKECEQVVQCPGYTVAWKAGAGPHEKEHGYMQLVYTAPHIFGNIKHYNRDRYIDSLYDAWITEIEDPLYVSYHGYGPAEMSLLNQWFPDSQFISSIRNPYCAISSPHQLDPHPYEELAKNWIELAKLVIRNNKYNGIFYRYEHLCAHPEQITEMISGMDYRLADFKCSEPIVDGNPKHFERYTQEQLDIVNKVLLERQDLLEFFGYKPFTEAIK